MSRVNVKGIYDIIDIVMYIWQKSRQQHNQYTAYRAYNVGPICKDGCNAGRGAFLSLFNNIWSFKKENLICMYCIQNASVPK